MDSNFGTAGNWSSGTVPGSGDDTCITATTATSPPAVADTYTITLNVSPSVHSLTLGGPNGTQTLLIPSGNLQFSLGAASAITAHGVLTLGDSGSGFSVLAGPGTLTNSGHLNTIAGGGNLRYLRTNISNAATGTIDIGTTTLQDQGGTLTTNNGTVTVEVAGSLALSNGFSFANNGAVTNSGAFSMSGGTFTHRGTASGNVVLLSGSTLDDDLGAGAGLFSFKGGGTLTGTGSNPGVPASQVVTVPAGNVEVALGVTLTNAGTITLGDGNNGYGILRGPGDLTNNGQLNAIAGGGGVRYLRVNINNGAAATIDIGTTTNLDGATLTTNTGTVTVEAGGSLVLTAGSSFANGGVVTNNGAFSVSGGGTFTHRGTVSGNGVLLSGSILDDDLGAGAGLFGFTTGGTLTGTGSNPGVPASQVVTISAANIEVALGVTLTNAGTITLGDSNNGYSVLRGPGDLTNTGQLNAIAGGGGVRYLRVNISNAAAGSIDIGTTTVQDQGTLTTNNGTVTVEVGGSLALSGGSSFANNGGAVTNNGAFSVSGGTFTQRGTVSGNVVLLSGSMLDDDLGAGAGRFGFTTGGTLTGTGSNPGVAAGQAVTVSAANIELALGVNLTNAGTITLGDGNNGYSVLRGPGDLTNSGQLNAVAGGGGIRYLRANINNTAAGTIELGTAANQDNGTTTTNNGTVAVEAAGRLALSGGSSFAQGACARFATTIDPNTTTFGQLTGGGGPVSLDGTLMVTTVGAPAIDSSWPIISGANRSGQFTTFDFVGSNNYDVQYTSTGVTLVVVAQAPPTPTAPTPPSCVATPTRTTPTFTTPTSTPTRTPTVTPTHTPTQTTTGTRAATFTPTATSTVTLTATQTHIPTSTATRPPSPSPTPTPTLTSVPTGAPTLTQTATPTPELITVSGRVRVPGPHGQPGERGLVPAVGVTVEAFVCEHPRTCLATPGAPVGSAVTDAAGHFSISIPTANLDGKFLLLMTTVDGVPIRAVVTAGRLRPIRTTRRAVQGGAADTPDIAIDPIAEATVRLLDAQGLENFSDAGVDTISDAVETANASTSFDGLTVEQATDSAETTAANDPTVQMVLQANLTPTPTPVVTCVGDCDRGGDVTINELIAMVNIALGSSNVGTCEAGDHDHNGEITIDEILTAVNNTLNGCTTS